MRRVFPLAVLAFFCFACRSRAPSPELVIAHQWGGPEKDAFDAVLDRFEEQHPETKLQRRSLSSEEYRAWIMNQFAAGSPPDVFVTSSPGFMFDLAKEERLLPLDDLWEAWTKEEWYDESWRALASYEGISYGVPFKAAAKGLIWYGPKEFAALDLSPPHTWEAWIAVLEKLKSTGKPPLLVGGKDGWPLSEWFEQLLLRVGGKPLFTAVWKHQVSWNDERVKQAFRLFASLVENYFPENPLATGFVEAVHARLDGKGFLQLQGGWVNLMSRDDNPDLVPGEDYSFFVMPPYDPKIEPAVIIGGDLLLVAAATQKPEEAKTLLRFLASPEAQSVWAKRGGFVATNAAVPPEIYPDANAVKEAALLRDAPAVVFDLDDLMPSGMQRVFWEQLQAFALQRDVEAVTTALEDAAARFYAE